MKKRRPIEVVRFGWNTNSIEMFRDRQKKIWNSRNTRYENIWKNETRVIYCKQSYHWLLTPLINSSLIIFSNSIVFSFISYSNRKCFPFNLLFILGNRIKVPLSVIWRIRRTQECPRSLKIPPQIGYCELARWICAESMSHPFRNRIPFSLTLSHFDSRFSEVFLIKALTIRYAFNHWYRKTDCFQFWLVHWRFFIPVHRLKFVSWQILFFIICDDIFAFLFFKLCSCLFLLLLFWHFSFMSSPF